MKMEGTPRQLLEVRLERVIEEASQLGAGLGDRDTLERFRLEALDGAFPVGDQRGFFLERDAEHLEEIANGFDRVTVHPKMPGPKHAEKARLETEMFRTRSSRLRSIAERIRKQIAAAG